MNKFLYKVEYLNNRYDRVNDYVLAKNKEECMEKFKMHHPYENGFIVNWQRVDY